MKTWNIVWDRKFRLHFNRINMQRGKPEVWTIHLSDRCIQVSEIDVDVPLKTVFKKDGKQPRAYLAGEGSIAYGFGKGKIMSNYLMSCIVRTTKYQEKKKK